MRRADRLFQILTLLRNRRTAITARQLAETLEVSERTIYRDVQSLICCGTPIEGEAGVGYRLNRQFDLPPLMFSTDEVEALLLGTRMVQAWSDQQLAAAADTAMQKILAALPDNLRHRDEQLAL
ncbi:MAG: HTH domain-containing protein, partial [Porticoccaceae bacterium]|nr:HTH domain-containing protein [Porticoccaceae bacterium]